MKYTLPISQLDWQKTPEKCKNLVKSLLEERESLVTKQEKIYDDHLKTINSLAELSRKQKVKANQVVLVTDAPIARDGKMAYGLWKAGWEVILIHGNAIPPTFDASRYCSRIYKYASIWEAFNLASSFNPLIYHVSTKMNYDLAELLVRFKPGKIIIDSYDGLQGMLKEEVLVKNGMLPQLEKEKFCWENADGLCCRHIESQFAKKKLGLKFRGKRILFLDCGWGNEIHSSVRREGDQKLADSRTSYGKKREMHIVYPGNIPLTHDSMFQLWLADRFREEKIHYHIYPPPLLLSVVNAQHGLTFESAFKSYIEHSSENPYFHFHRPIPAEQVVSEISQYNFGISVSSRDFKGINSSLNVDNDYTEYKDYHAIASKIFDYFEAGLPILIHSKGKFARFIASRYNGAVEATEDVIFNKGHLLEIEEEIKANAVISSQKYAISAHIPRLIKFYETIVANTSI